MSRTHGDLEAGETEAQNPAITAARDSNSIPKLATTDDASKVEAKIEVTKENDNPSGISDDDVLADWERASYQYSCHRKSKSPDTQYERVKRRFTAQFGRNRGVRLTPPMYRKHEDIARENIAGNFFKVLANECMEQLYDDNPNGKFGSIGVLSFARLHHMNLHYFEADLAAELATVIKKKDTDRRQMMRIRKKLREYSKDIILSQRDY
ncbi:hypothetical protein H2201_007568 [Coniosporium apollinis]|uniref:Uncharacterized protein n=1 Tax=Coniosporium apollinis TaxID=61459 RepID=A0ABQ9NQE5_9PEZI|nr:hypothetical protein H2201_007568 [Coniosporium apollinis]